MDDLPGRAGPDLARSWGVEVERVVTTDRSVLSFGLREGAPVVLKVTSHGDERRRGEVLAAFAGRGAFRVLAHLPGALLMERACPGGALLHLVDDEATAILARTLASMRPDAAPPGLPTVETLG